MGGGVRKTRLCVREEVRERGSRKCGDLYSGEAGLDDISAIAKR